MKSLFLATIFGVMLSGTAVAQCKLQLKIGAKISAKCLPNKDEALDRVATAPSQSRPFIKLKIAGVQYTVAFDEETRRIKYIHTSDRTFRTVNGLQAGSQIKVTQEQLTDGFGGWYTFAGQTPDGWDVIVGTDLLNDWKKGEVRTLTIGGFKKGGN